MVAEGSTNTGGNQARRKRTQARDKDIVSRPFEIFSRTKRDKVTNPIGTELRGPCALHCPHLPLGQNGTAVRPGAGNAAGTYRRMLLNDVDAAQGSFVPPS